MSVGSHSRLIRLSKTECEGVRQLPRGCIGVMVSPPPRPPSFWDVEISERRASFLPALLTGDERPIPFGLSSACLSRCPAHSSQMWFATVADGVGDCSAGKGGGEGRSPRLEPASPSPGETKAFLLRHFEGWHAPISSLIRATEETGVAREDARAMSRLGLRAAAGAGAGAALRRAGRCFVLVGDAAHTVRKGDRWRETSSGTDRRRERERERERESRSRCCCCAAN